MSAQKITKKLINQLTFQSCWKTRQTDNALYVATKCMSAIFTPTTYISGKNLIPKNHNSEIWYTRGHLGKIPLGQFISELSTSVGTSKHYTKHCVRVSTTNIVTNTGLFNDKEVMDFTGHKSNQSLQIHMCMTKEKKMQMSKELNKVINKMKDQLEEEEKQKEIMAPQPRPAIEPSPPPITLKSVQDLNQNVEAAIVPFEPKWDDDDTDFDLMQILSELEDGN